MNYRIKKTQQNKCSRWFCKENNTKRKPNKLIQRTTIRKVLELRRMWNGRYRGGNKIIKEYHVKFFDIKF